MSFECECDIFVQVKNFFYANTGCWGYFIACNYWTGVDFSRSYIHAKFGKCLDKFFGDLLMFFFRDTLSFSCRAKDIKRREYVVTFLCWEGDSSFFYSFTFNDLEWL